MSELLRLTEELGGRRTAFPALDATHDDTEVSLRAEVPGFGPEHVSLAIEGRRLTISGRLPEPAAETSENEANGAEAPRLRGPVTKFDRVIALPYRVDAEAARAKVEHGVLELTLPRAKDELPKRIEIRTS